MQSDSGSGRNATISAGKSPGANTCPGVMQISSCGTSRSISFRGSATSCAPGSPPTHRKVVASSLFAAGAFTCNGQPPTRHPESHVCPGFSSWYHHGQSNRCGRASPGSAENQRNSHAPGTKDTLRRQSHQHGLGRRPSCHTLNLLAASTGLRMGEAQGLHVQHVHRQYVTIVNIWERKYRLKDHPIWNSAREAPIPLMLCSTWRDPMGESRALSPQRQCSATCIGARPNASLTS